MSAITDEQMEQIVSRIREVAPDIQFIIGLFDGENISCGMEAKCSGCLLNALFSTAADAGLTQHNPKDIIDIPKEKMN